jgi:multicomponent K+:H+ antiporter subunit E
MSARRPAWPHPVLSALLALAWLLLQTQFDLAAGLVALLLGWGLPWLCHGFLGALPGPRAWAVATRLLCVVLWDIGVSNIAVLRIVLNPRSRPQPAWVPVPLQLRHPWGLALLASIITTTPGTVSCVIDEARQRILVHALDCSDVPGLVSLIQDLYERPLREIFE